MQLIIDAVYLGSLYALASLAFSMVNAITHRFHFGLGISMLIGPYAAFGALGVNRFGLLLAVTAGLAVAVAVDLAVYATIFRRLIGNAQNDTQWVLGAVGATAIVQHCLAIAFGVDPIFASPQATTSIYIGATGHLGAAQMACIALSAAAALLMHWASAGSNRLALLYRAVANDAELSRARHVPVGRVFATSWATSSLIGAGAGMFMSLDLALWPSMWIRLVVIASAICILCGGDLRPIRVLAVSLLFGLSERAALNFVPTAWIDAIIFAFLAALVAAQLVAKAATARFGSRVPLL